MNNSFCTLTVAYNEERLIGGMLEGVKDLYNLVIISKPWHGIHKEFDDTEKIAKLLGAEVILKDFSTQTDEREFGRKMLRNMGYEYIFVLDADEYYLKEDINRMIEFIKKTKVESYRSAKSDRIYWKDENWYFTHGGFNICIRSDIKFTSGRANSAKKVAQLPPDIQMHHFGYARTDEEMLTKITTCNFSKNARKGWFENVWKRWTPEMKDLGVVVAKQIPKVFKTKEIPNEILDRLNMKIL